MNCMSLPQCPNCGSRIVSTKACHSCGENFHKGGGGSGTKRVSGFARSDSGQAISGPMGGDKPPIKNGGLTRQQVETRWRREVGRTPTKASVGNGLKRRLADEIAFRTDRPPPSKSELGNVSVRDLVKQAKDAGVRPSWTPSERQHYKQDLEG